MKLALGISFYIFLLLALFGGFLLVWLFRWIYGEKDLTSLFPKTKKLPQPALQEVKKLLRKIREHVPKASPAHRERFLRDLDLADKTLQEVEVRIQNQQENYYQLCQEREKMWNSLKAFTEKMSPLERVFSKKTNPLYLKKINAYKNIHERIAEAQEHAKFQGELLLAEIQKRGVYQRNVALLNPSKKDGAASSQEENAQTAEDTQSPSEATQDSGKKHPSAQKNETATADSEKAGNPTASTPTSNQPIVRPDLKQGDFPRIGINVRHYQYVDATFHLDFEESRVLRHYDFEGTAFQNVQFVGVHEYTHCNFKEADFTGAAWLQAPKPHRFRHCNFTQANLSEGCFEFAAFYYCQFAQSQWEQLQLRNVKLVSCVLDETRWQQVDLSQVLMSKDMLARLDFSPCPTLPQNHPDRLQAAAQAPPSQQNPPESTPAASTHKEN